MGRAPCCDKANVKKGPWSPEEDAKLKAYIEQHGTGGNWIALPQKIGLKRCGKSCRLRWLNYLRPNIKHGGFSEEEDNMICSLYVTIGSRWSIIASQLPGRTDNDIKNYWNTKLKKKLLGKQRKEQQAQARTKQAMMKSETENLVTPVNQNPTWPSHLCLPTASSIQHYHHDPNHRNLLNKLEGTFSHHHQQSHSDTLTHTINSHCPLLQLEHHLYSTSINSPTAPLVNNSSNSSCQSPNIFEVFENFPNDYWSEPVSVKPQQLDGTLQGCYGGGMGSTGSASTESTSWGDITSSHLVYSLVSGYEGVQQGMPQDIATFEESTYFGVQ